MSRKKTYCYADTTVAYFLLSGHTLQRDRAEKVRGGREWRISPLVRMEYIRGVIITLIEFHSLLKQSGSVADAIAEWSNQFENRRIRVLMRHIMHVLNSQKAADDRTITARRLRVYVQELLEQFDAVFTKTAPNHLACKIAPLQFSDQEIGDRVLIEFAERFFRVFEGTPDCNQCGFRQYWTRKLQRQGIDLHGTEQQMNFAEKTHVGYRNQAAKVQEALNVVEGDPQCKWCVRLGDTMIALQCPDQDELVAGDRAFDALSTILKKKFTYIPSVAAIRRETA